MNILSQVIQLLSEPPGSIIYHLVMLFSVQIVFAFSYTRLRRDRDDELARRMVWSSVGLVAVRLLLVLAAIFYASDERLAASIMPPLEMALNTASIALIVWGLAAQLEKTPRLLDLALVIVLAFTAVGYMFFAQVWRDQLLQGIVAYNDTLQSTIWATMQMAVLLGGLALVLRDRQARSTLRPLILSILLVTTILQSWRVGQPIQIETSVPYWIRFGFLVAMPLWAVFAFQYTLSPILSAARSHEEFAKRAAQGFHSAAQVIATSQSRRRLVIGLELIADLLASPLVSVAHLDIQDDSRLLFRGRLPGTESGDVNVWHSELDQFASMRMVIRQGLPIQLLPHGAGARQLHAFYQQLAIDPLGAILIQPLMAGKKQEGLLVVARPAGEDQWTDASLQLASGASAFVTQALLNSRRPLPEMSDPVPEVKETQPDPHETRVVPSAILLNNAQLHVLERENENLRLSLAKNHEEKLAADRQAKAARQQARYLGDLLRKFQEHGTKLPIDENIPDPVLSSLVDEGPESSQGKF